MILSWSVVKRHLVACCVMLLSMLVIWWTVWQIGAAQYRSFIDGWIAAHRGGGYQLTYDERDTVGFPRRITLRFTNFVLQNPDGVRIRANDVSLSAFPWQWNRFDAKLKHGFEMTIPFSDAKILVLRTDITARNHTELDANGDWKFVNLELSDAKAMWGTDPFFSASTFNIGMERPDYMPKDRHDAGLTIGALVENLSLPADIATPFGPSVGKIDVGMRVMGVVPDPRRRDAVETWSNGSGTVEFDKFDLDWGPLILAGRGSLGLDDDLQPEGAFSAQIGNHLDVLKRLMDAGYIPTRETGMLDSALNLFTKRAVVAGRPGIEAPIAVQLGGLFLGPVRVFEYPEIAWEPAAAPVPADAAPAVASPAAQ